MASDDIYMSTTDIIPNYPNKVISKSEVTWGGSATTTQAAYNSLEKWAREHGYNAIVGVRFLARGAPDGGVAYVMYGTAVAWEY